MLQGYIATTLPSPLLLLLAAAATAAAAAAAAATCKEKIALLNAKNSVPIDPDATPPPPEPIFASPRHCRHTTCTGSGDSRRKQSCHERARGERGTGFHGGHRARRPADGGGSACASRSGHIRGLSGVTGGGWGGRRGDRSSFFCACSGAGGHEPSKSEGEREDDFDCFSTHTVYVPLAWYYLLACYQVCIKLIATLFAAPPHRPSASERLLFTEDHS